MATIVFMTLAEIAAAGGKIITTRFLNGLMFDNNAGRVVPAGTLSYITALVEGQEVRVSDAPEGLTTSHRNAKKELIEWAKENKVYAKGVGLLDTIQFA
jgi:hypothetical protein